MELEEDKRNLIHREIDKFRDTYKKYDEEEEKRNKDDDKSRDKRRYDDPGRTQRGLKNKYRDRNRRSQSIEGNFDHSKSPIDEEKLLIKRHQEKINREKEISYQRRLKDWELRERRKFKDYEKAKYREYETKEDQEIERQKLKQFLQDYNDDK